MAPSKNSLFDSPPPTTLDHFFAKPESSNRSASSQVPKRVKASHLSSQRIERVQLPQTEIIIIDSDDDAPPTNSKRKAVAEEDNSGGGSSDVEIVGAIIQNQRASDAPSSGKKAKVKGGPGLDDLNIQEDGLTSSQVDSLHFAEFDELQLLIPTKDDVSPSVEAQNFQTAMEDRRHVVAPAPLSTELDVLHPLQDVRNCSDGFSTNSVQAGPDNVIEICDEWGTGDDELVRTNEAEVDGVLELTDDDEIEEVIKLEGDPLAIPGDTIDQCSFCGSILTNVSLLVSSLS